MAKVLVLYYSTYGHIEKMAGAVAEGAREGGGSVDIKRVPELVPADVAKASHFKVDQPAPVATIGDLERYDAIIVGTPTRFGRITSQMASFLDQAWRPVGPWCFARKGRRSVHFIRDAARRSGNYLIFNHYQSAPFRDDCGRAGLRSRGTDDLERDHRRQPLWREHDRRWRRIALADRE